MAEPLKNHYGPQIPREIARMIRAGFPQFAERAFVRDALDFIKLNGKSTPKAFKLRTLDLPPLEGARVRKTLALRNMTSRKHYCGKHRLELLLNGRSSTLGAFTVLQAPAKP